MAVIDYYLFPISPFTYLAGTKLEQIAARHGANIIYKPFNLMKVFEATGTPPLPQRHESRKAYRLAEIARIAQANDLPVNPHPAHFPTNPVPAAGAIIAAQEAGGGDVGALTYSLLRACWAEDRDIADDQVIHDCLTSAGFAPDLADKGMLSAVETYERNTQDALDALVFGAPTYVVNGQVFWGQDRLDYLDRYLASL